MAEFGANENANHDPCGERAAGPGVGAEGNQGDPARAREDARVNARTGVMLDGPQNGGDSRQRQKREKEAGLVWRFCVHRSRSSSSIEPWVFSSRYFTMTGVYKLSPHSAALLLPMARDPGTTTAFSGITSGASALER